jgi:hypothetical protein
MKRTRSRKSSEQSHIRNTLRETNAPKEICIKKLVGHAEAQYNTFSTVGRDRFFKHVNANTNVHAVLNVDTPPGARGQKPMIQLPINASGTVEFGTFRRFQSVLLTSIEHALKKKKKNVVWIPLTLVPIDLGIGTHSNAIHINLEKRTILLFEPHGSDVTPVEHGSWHNFYRDVPYYTMFKNIVRRVLPGYALIVPSDYQPAVFGQSKTNIKRLLGIDGSNGDPWCVLWTCVFFKYTLHMTPQQFVEKIQKMSSDELTHFLTLELLSWRTWCR